MSAPCHRTIGVLFYVGALFLFVPDDLMGQRNGEGREDTLSEGKVKVEVRPVQRKESGEVMNGSLPDSLGGRYFFHENGKVYKHFSQYEAALAHLRGGHHPRDEMETEKGVIYISSAPTIDESIEEPFEMEVERSPKRRSTKGP